MQWSVKSEEEAQALLPENNMQDGTYWGVVKRQEVMKGKVKEDGTVGNDWLKLNILFETPAGNVFGEASIFNSDGRMFFVRKHFWESAGKPDNFNAPPEEYLDQRIQAKVKVESYFSNKYQETKKKYVVTDFIGNSAKEKMQKSDEKFPDENIPF